jgi:hypothetical protein
VHVEARIETTNYRKTLHFLSPRCLSFEKLNPADTVVVIETPPSLVADAQILAGKVDAVLFVIRPGKTTAQWAI